MESWQKLTNPSDVAFGKVGMFRVKVTPDVARQFLEKNISNRRVRKTLVDYLIKQIKSGEWQSEHPQPIVFSDTGRLIDGQHRLLAITACDESCICTIRTGCPDGVREYLDTGIVRTLDDRVEFVRENPGLNKMISQIVSVWWFGIETNRYGGKPSPEQAREMFCEHEEAITVMAKLLLAGKKRAIGRTAVAVAACEFYERDKEKAIAFYDSVFVPDGPIQQARILRDWLLRNTATLGGGTKATSKVHERVVYCMCAYLRGRQVSSVRAGSWE